MKALDSGDRSLVPEAGIEDGSLRSLCTVGSAHSDEVPVAVVRVEIADVAAAEAVQLARRTAATLGALGTFYGASSTLWTVEGSFVSFREGHRSAATFQAAVNERVSLGESQAMKCDPTAPVLDHERERLGRLLPVRGGRMLDLAELLLWLQDARAAPDAARLVLCDRAIESVSGWVGAATPRRFVEDHLIPSWALGRVHQAARSIAFDIVYNVDREHYFEHLPEHREWRGLMDDERLDLRNAAEGHAAAGLAGMLEHIDLLNEGVPAGHRARRALDRLLIDAASPKAAVAWLDRLVERGRINESRRSRTRNALMHGGPLSAATVSTVLPFAQYMADESLGRALEALLADRDVAAVFLERSREVARVRRCLKAAVPVHEALS